MVVENSRRFRQLQALILATKTVTIVAENGEYSCPNGDNLSPFSAIVVAVSVRRTAIVAEKQQQ